MHVGTRLVLSALGALLMPHFAAAQDGVEMDIRNRTPETMTVFALWESGARVRLGNLSPNQTRSFTTAVEGQEVTLAVQTSQGGVRGRGARTGGDRPEDFAPVRPGDRLEWEIHQSSPLDLSYRRVASVSVSDDIDSQEPRVSRYTALSAMAIQEAQEQEDEALQEQAYREVLESIYDGLAREDDNPQAYLHLAIVHTGLRNYLAADSAFDRAEAFYPDYVDEERGTGVYRLNAWIQAYNSALGMMDAGDPEGSVEFFMLANLLFDKRPEAYLNLGVQMAGLGDLEGSIEAWRSAIAVIESPDADPENDETREAWDTQFWPMAHSNLGRVLQMAERFGEAVLVYQMLLERDPDNQQARSGLALALVNSGQGDDALTIFDEILASEDEAPLDYFNAAVSLYQADQLDKAVVGFEKALEAVPMYRDALQNLIQTFSLLEDYEAQALYSERLLELDPYNAFAHQIHVRALSQLGRQTDLVAAINILEELPFVIDYLRLQPTNSGVSVSGQAINKTLEPGTTITLRFTFYDNDGNPLGTEDVEVTISDPEVAHQFQLSFDAEVQVLGYSYEFVS